MANSGGNGPQVGVPLQAPISSCTSFSALPSQVTTGPRPCPTSALKEGRLEKGDSIQWAMGSSFMMWTSFAPWEHHPTHRALGLHPTQSGSPDPPPKLVNTPLLGPILPGFSHLVMDLAFTTAQPLQACSLAFSSQFPPWKLLEEIELDLHTWYFWTVQAPPRSLLLPLKKFPSGLRNPAPILQLPSEN